MYKEAVSPVLDRLDSERMHITARELLHMAEATPFTLKILEHIANQGPRIKDERLKVVLGGVEFDNPLIVGPGWDKPGRAVRALYAMGFAGVEIGSVLARPQGGNEKRRQFIVGPGVSINWLGYNTPPGGMDDVENNLNRYRNDGIPTGIGVGKNMMLEPGEDIPGVYATVVERFYETASWFTYGFSPNSGLDSLLKDTTLLTDMIQRAYGAMDKKGKRKDLYVKVGPDLSYASLDNVIRVVMDQHVTGIIAVNSTTNSDIKAKYGERWRSEKGGLTGDDPDYRKMAVDSVRHIYQSTKSSGRKIEIVGVGGIKDAQTAIERLRAGAGGLQLVTAIRGEGPTVANKINRGLLEYIKKEGIGNVGDIVGADHANLAA